VIPLVEVLRELGVDEQIVDWAASADDDPHIAWLTCPRGAWLVHIALRANVERTLVVRAAEACATLAVARLSKEVRAPARTLHLVRRWVDGHAEAAACWASGFAASAAAIELEGEDELAARAAACVAFACDDNADPLYYSVRAHAVEAIDLAERAMGGRPSVRALCAAEVRRHLRADYVLACLGTAHDSQRPAAFPGMEDALAEGMLRVDVGSV
jgi:hypothetical protein